MKTLAYIFGQPGSGKTTLMRALCEAGKPLYEADAPVKHRALMSPHGTFAVLGADAAPFGGTDTLSYTAVGDSPRWLKGLSGCSAGSLVFAEGDRLANLRFFEEAARHYRLLAFYLACDDRAAQSRREDRAQRHGLPLQSSTWVKGRITKHANLAARHTGTIRLDASKPPGELASIVWKTVLKES
jgi:thymidylate kinase